MFSTPFGDFRLRRYPGAHRGAPRAWNSADELLLRAAADVGAAASTILLVNDEHGALAVPLAGARVWTDSKLSELAITANFRANGIAAAPVLSSMDQALPGEIELVLLRVPKQLALLRYQLQALRRLLPAGTPVVCAGMDKHLSPSIAAIMETFLGPTRRHRGERKARLFSITVDKTRTTSEPRFKGFTLDELDGEVEAGPNVFSRERLDGGSRLLLGEFARLPAATVIADLGCGNGVLGMVAAKRLQPRRTIFVDESAMAIASARHNVQRLLPGHIGHCEFRQADGFTDAVDPAPELVLCNPPFHHHHAVDESGGQRLIRQVAGRLAPDGEFWLVANRHLPYAGLLRRSFMRLTRVTQNSKFVVWRAVGARRDNSVNHPQGALS